MNLLIIDNILYIISIYYIILYKYCRLLIKFKNNGEKALNFTLYFTDFYKKLMEFIAKHKAGFYNYIKYGCLILIKLINGG